MRRTVLTALAAAVALVGSGVLGATAPTPALALDNGLARIPQMGFDNWNLTHCGSRP